MQGWKCKRYMESYNIYLYIIALILVGDFAWSQYLSYRNRRRMSSVIPPALDGIYEPADYAKQQDYQKANSRFGLYSGFFSFITMFLFLVLGGFGWLDSILREYITNEIWLGLAYLGVLMLVSEIISLPFDYYATFVIEERFGFNKSTKKTFWLDQLKGLLLSVVIGGALLSVIIWLYSGLEQWAWAVAWIFMSGFSLFFSLFYSNLIVPLFNKQTPLEDGELRSAIESFGKKAGFGINNIYVMDASKRSSKANAYFTGMGAKKRIVLYDTLINDLEVDEIVAVLAHEIGHYKKKHTQKGMIVSVFSMGVMLFLLSFFLTNTPVAVALGAEKASFHLGLIAFSMLFTPFSMLLGLLGNIMSRKHEYQADYFASQYGLAEPLIDGLKKLSVKSLSNLNPDPLFVKVYYSHPTLLQRISALSK